jgi:hypothetical protein
MLNSDDEPQTVERIPCEVESYVRRKRRRGIDGDCQLCKIVDKNDSVEGGLKEFWDFVDEQKKRTDHPHFYIHVANKFNDTIVFWDQKYNKGKMGFRRIDATDVRKHFDEVRHLKEYKDLLIHDEREFVTCLLDEIKTSVLYKDVKTGATLPNFESIKSYKLCVNMLKDTFTMEESQIKRGRPNKTNIIIDD